MKNILWIFSVSVVFTLSSCISTAQFNNAEDDVYYSPKASNRKQPVMIPEVNVDEIIKKNPPQYGQPTNRVDDVTPNPNAAEGYRAYKAQQDSLYQQDPTLSGYYVNPNLPNSESDEVARRNNRWFKRSYYSRNRWNYGLGWNSLYGPGISLGYSNFGYNNYYGNNWGCNYGYYPYNSWGYSPYYYNNWNSYYGCNPGFGFGYGYGNPFYNNYYGGYPGYGYGYGYGNYYAPGYYYDNYNNSGSGNAGNQPISKPRPGVGGSTPPNNGGQNGGGRGYVAPPQATDQPQPGTNPGNGRTNTPTNMAPATGQTLENVNGRPVYTRPQETPQPVQTQTPNNPAPGYQRGSAPANYVPSNAQRLENVNGRVIYTRPQEITQPVQTQTPANPGPGYQRAPDNGNYQTSPTPAPAMQRPTNDSRGSYSPPPANNGGGLGTGSSGGRGGSSGGSGGSVGGRRR